MLLKLYIMILLAGIANCGFAQSASHVSRQANKLYRAKKYAKAEVEYRKALQKDGKRSDISYNLARSLQAENKQEEALKVYEQAAKLENNAVKRSSSYYNAGTIYQQKKDYSKAIEAYKNALRSNPTHQKARYNLELCKQQQKQQQNNRQNKQQDKNNKNKQQQKNNQKNNNRKNSSKQDNSLSKDNAQRLLNAAMQQEKATQDKLSKAMRQPSNRQLDKNW